MSRIGYPLTLDSRQRALSACPLSKQCSRESLESRTSRSASVHRLLASNSTEPAPMGKSLYQQTGTQEGICDSTIQKKRKKKPYIPGRPHRRPTAAPATRLPDSTSPGTASARPTGRQYPPTPNPVSPAPPQEQDSSPEPGGTRLCSAQLSSQLAVAHQMPLRETQGPQQ